MSRLLLSLAFANVQFLPISTAPSLMVLGLIGAVVLAHGSLVKAIAMIILGLLLGIVGTDVNSGVARFDFGIPELSDGLGVVSVAMGLFGFAEIIMNLESTEKRAVIAKKVTGLGFDRQTLLDAGIDSAGAFAAVSSGDNSNIISARSPGRTFAWSQAATARARRSSAA